MSDFINHEKKNIERFGPCITECAHEQEEFFLIGKNIAGCKYLIINVSY